MSRGATRKTQCPSSLQQILRITCSQVSAATLLDSPATTALHTRGTDCACAAASALSPQAGKSKEELAAALSIPRLQLVSQQAPVLDPAVALPAAQAAQASQEKLAAATVRYRKAMGKLGFTGGTRSTLHSVRELVLHTTTLDRGHCSSGLLLVQVRTTPACWLLLSGSPLPLSWQAFSTWHAVAWWLLNSRARYAQVILLAGSTEQLPWQALSARQAVGW